LNFEVAGFDPSSNRIPLTAFVHLKGDGCAEQGKPLSATRARVFEAGELRSARRSPRYRHSDGPRGAGLADEEERASEGQQQQQIQPDDKKE
jgi:hypothetical protein